MSSSDIHRRLMRLENRLAQSEREAARQWRLAELQDRKYADKVAEALAYKSDFIDDVHIAFRKPERAMDKWQSLEWEAANLTFESRSPQEVAKRAGKALADDLLIHGLQLNGSAPLGKEDNVRLAAKAAVQRLAKHRAGWLAAEQEARGLVDLYQDRKAKALEASERFTQEQITKRQLLKELNEALERENSQQSDLRMQSNAEPEPEVPEPLQALKGEPGSTDPYELYIYHQSREHLRNRIGRLSNSVERYDRLIQSDPFDGDVPDAPTPDQKAAFARHLKYRKQLKARRYAAKLRLRELSNVNEQHRTRYPYASLTPSEQEFFRIFAPVSQRKKEQRKLSEQLSWRLADVPGHQLTEEIRKERSIEMLGVSIGRAERTLSQMQYKIADAKQPTGLPTRLTPPDKIRAMERREEELKRRLHAAKIRFSERRAERNLAEQTRNRTIEDKHEQEQERIIILERARQLRRSSQRNIANRIEKDDEDISLHLGRNR